jgi:transcriptional regulator with XRE-family HTH domain
MPTVVNTDNCDTLQASLGERLVELRSELGMTQIELADCLGITSRTIRGYETGTTTIPTDTLYRMMEIGIDVPYLLFGQRTLFANRGNTTHVDDELLKRAIEWVDGEWSQNPDGERITDHDRIKWVMLAYLSIVGDSGTQQDAEIDNKLSRRKSNAG